jgi:hypothetical protein
MNEAIKLAIEKGGYILRKHVKKQFLDGWGVEKRDAYEITQDPLFWQALGKALGWKRIFEDLLETMEFNDIPTNYFMPYVTWQYYAHQYFDLVLTGGDTEKFWKGMLA